METSTTKNKLIHSYNMKEKMYIRYFDTAGETKFDVVDTPWYFIIRTEDQQKANYVASTNSYTVRFSKAENPLYTMVFPVQKESRYSLVKLMESHDIKTFEGDLPFDKRWYIDKRVEIADKFKKLYFDIETDDSNEKINVGMDRIVSFAAVDDEGKVYFEIIEKLTDKAEKELMVKFLQMIAGYDILLGWNTKEFDIPYLKARMVKFGLNKDYDLYGWNKIASFDLLKRFRHIFRFDNHIKKFSLDYISKHFLDRGKLDHGQKIHVLYKKDKETLKEYNIKDCLLVKELDEKLGVSDMMIKQCQWCGVPPAQFGLYAILDAYMLKKAHEIGEYCPTSLKALEEKKWSNVRGNEDPDSVKKDEAKYTGAAVLTPKTGFYKKVYSFDFKSLYPTMMRTSNIGFDSIMYEDDGTCIINPGTNNIERKSKQMIPTFFSKKKSVITLALTEMMTKRKEYKKIKLQMVEDGTNKGPLWERVVSDEIIVKELSNSIYGIMGLEYGRYFSIDIAESITLFGQWVINFSKSFFESRGFEVIYGDTDSVFITNGKEIDQEEELKHFHVAIEKEMLEKYRIGESIIELEPDKTYETFLLIAKKNYAGHITNLEGKKTDDIYSRGLEFIKKNTFGFGAICQESLLNLVLRHEFDESTLRKYVSDCKDSFDSKVFTPQELSIVQRVGRNPKDYVKSVPMHVKLAMEDETENTDDVKSRDVEYIVTGYIGGMQGVLMTNFTGEFSREYYWEKKTLPLLDRILDTIYPPPLKEKKVRVKKPKKGEQLPGQLSIFDVIADEQNTAEA